MRVGYRRFCVGLWLVVAVACGHSTPVVASAGARVAAALDSLPNDAMGRAIRRGHALVVSSHDSLPAFVSATLSCTSCHLDEGERATAFPLTTAFVRYPRFIVRADAVASIEDRVNYCITRSFAGRPLGSDSREMHEIVAYLAFLSRGKTVTGISVSPPSLPMPKLVGDSARGRTLFASTCARCHGADGMGAAGPALWGPTSFSIGASMAREERAAAFIRHNMPYDRAGTLTDQQAFDVAAFMTTQPRPDLPGKANDWPLGGAPYDVPYDTKGHSAFHPPRVLLPREAPPITAPVAAPALPAGHLAP